MVLLLVQGLSGWFCEPELPLQHPPGVQRHNCCTADACLHAAAAAAVKGATVLAP